MFKILSLFEIVNMSISACKICPKMTFLDLGPTLGPTYLIIVDQILVKLVSDQTYLGKELLQSILQLWIFPYNPLEMWKKSIEVVNLTILALHSYNFQNFS